MCFVFFDDTCKLTSQSFVSISEIPVSLVDLRKALNGHHQLQGGESKKREHSNVDESKVNTRCCMPLSVELALNCDFIQIVTKRKQNSMAKKVHHKVVGLIF